MSATVQDPMLAPYYTTDLTITITNIEATSKKQAEAIMNGFIDVIGLVMADKIRWDECDWEIIENVYDPEYGVWVEQ
jgi:hypothetical protein